MKYSKLHKRNKITRSRIAASSINSSTTATHLTVYNEVLPKIVFCRICPTEKIFRLSGYISTNWVSKFPPSLCTRRILWKCEFGYFEMVHKTNYDPATDIKWTIGLSSETCKNKKMIKMQTSIDVISLKFFVFGIPRHRIPCWWRHSLKCRSKARRPQ